MGGRISGGIGVGCRWVGYHVVLGFVHVWAGYQAGGQVGRWVVGMCV